MAIGTTEEYHRLQFPSGDALMPGQDLRERIAKHTSVPPIEIDMEATSLGKHHIGGAAAATAGSGRAP